MKLSELQIEPRVRTDWQCLDLGTLLAVRWWWPLFLSWVVPALIVFIPVITFFGDSWWGLLLWWWFKPLYDRGPLILLSRFMFNQQVSYKEIPKLVLSSYKSRILMPLTFGRFTTKRSFSAPIAVLERASGDAFTKRKHVLASVSGSGATWATIGFYHIEVIIYLGVMALVLFLLPSSVVEAIGIFDLENQGYWAYLFQAVFYFLAAAVVAPVYIASGFMLYLNGRVKLEAWDIELQFKRLKNRFSAVLPTLLLAGLLVLSMPFNSGEAYAEEPNTDAVNTDQLVEDAERAQKRIEKILEGDAFNRQETVERWRLKEYDPSDPNIPQWLIDFLSSIFGSWNKDDSGSAQFWVWLFKMLPYVLLLLAIGVIAYLAYRNRTVLMRWVPSSIAPTAKQPDVLFGLDITKESLPNDVSQAATEAIQRGDYREAVSLLYRASLAILVLRYDVELDDSYTEGECLTVVKRLSHKQIPPYFSRLTAIWQSIAYQHRTPKAELLLPVAESWNEVFIDA